jgi:hypothetical protein
VSFLFGLGNWNLSGEIFGVLKFPCFNAEILKFFMFWNSDNLKFCIFLNYEIPKFEFRLRKFCVIFERITNMSLVVFAYQI